MLASPNDAAAATATAAVRHARLRPRPSAARLAMWFTLRMGSSPGQVVGSSFPVRFVKSDRFALPLATFRETLNTERGIGTGPL